MKLPRGTNMKIIKKIQIEATADKVWGIFAHDFDSASEWMASIPNSYGESTSKAFEGNKSEGRVCELNGNPNGIKATEEFLAYDEINKTCTVDVTLLNTPAVMPILGNILDFEIQDVGANRSEVTWTVTSKLKPHAYIIYPLIKFGLGILVGQIIEELKHFVEQGQPHPRKVKATAKLKLAANGQS